MGKNSVQFLPLRKTTDIPVIFVGSRLKRGAYVREAFLNVGAVLLILGTETHFFILIPSTPWHLFRGDANKPF